MNRPLSALVAGFAAYIAMPLAGNAESLKSER